MLCLPVSGLDCNLQFNLYIYNKEVSGFIKSLIWKTCVFHNFCFHFSAFDPRLVNTLEHVQLPSSLQQMTFQNRFNQTIERVILPEKLEVLSFGFRFNQSLEHVNLPATLRSLTFGHNFNQDLCLGPRWMGRFWHVQPKFKGILLGRTSLCQKTLASEFLGDVPGYVGNSLLFNLIFAILNFFRLRVRFPSGLETLAFGNDFAQSLVLLANHSFSVSLSCWIGCICLCVSTS